MRETRKRLEPPSFWDDELAALDAQVTAIFAEAAVLAAIQRVQPPAGEMTLAAIIAYRQAVKAELQRMVRPQ